MQQASPHRAFVVTVGWTLLLLFLGSVVHATESSLACPDWPTCFGSMVPEMEGGVFWEHLHRLVAGGLLLMFALATWLARRQADRWVVRACWLGLGLLLVQSVFGGLTVLWRLPDAVSTTHLALAFLFLALAAVLAAGTSPRRGTRPVPGPDARRTLRRLGGWTAGAVFLQSVLGGAVRHTDAGMACGRGVLCNGGLLPSAWPPHEVGVHWLHRALAVVVAGLVVWLALSLARRGAPDHVRRAAWAAVLLVALQVALGFLSAWTVLAVAPVSLHTLVAAALLALTAALAAWGWLRPAVDAREAGEPTPREDAAASPATP